MDKQQAVAIIKTITAAYPNLEMTEGRVDMWINMILPMDYEKSMTRLRKHILEKPYPPTVSEVAAKPKPVNKALEKEKRWEEEVRAERYRKQRG